MSPEAKIFLGLSAGAALVTGLLPRLLIGLGAGYVVYRIHYAQSVEELGRILAFVERKLDEMDERDQHRKTLEGLREKIAAKKAAVRVGSGLIGTGTFLSPIVGVVYLIALVAVKNRAQQKAMAAIDRQIEDVLHPNAAHEEEIAEEGESLFLQALRATAHATGRVADYCIGFEPGKVLRVRTRASA